MSSSSLGVAATSYLSVWETLDTLQFLEKCRRFGAAGIHAVLHGNPLTIRVKAEAYGMYVEAMIPLPDGEETAEFEQSLRNATLAGATALRGACLGTRRYETFANLKQWNDHVTASHRSLEAAVPLLEKYKIPLGLENHKDWTAPELLAILRKYSSEYLGVCLDFGNNISLLELPMETIEALAPYTVSTHLKDVAVASYEEGVLLTEVILGSGIIDIPRAVNIIKEARPETRMSLEMITRSPLRIPMLNEQYWATFPDKTAGELARTLLFVNQNQSRFELGNDEDQSILSCLEVWRSMGL